jgi:G3E family GTPase
MERYQHPYIRRLLRSPASVRHLARARAGVPLTVVTGEPGAGKTTLLRKLMESSTPGSVAVLRHDSETSSRLSELVHTANHAFLEVASPADLPRASGFAYMPGYRPCGTIVLMSGPSVLSMRADVLPQRIHEASVIIINKADLLAGTDVQRAAAWLRRNVAPMPVLFSQHARIAAPLFLGVDQRAMDGNIPLVVAPWSHTFEISERSRRQRAAAPASAEACRAWSLHGSIPLDPTAFRGWVERLPRTVIRGHGTVTFEIEQPIQHRFELFGAHWGLERIGQLDRGLTQSRVWLVGVT